MTGSIYDDCQRDLVRIFNNSIIYSNEIVRKKKSQQPDQQTDLRKEINYHESMFRMASNVYYHSNDKSYIQSRIEFPTMRSDV